MFQFSMNKRIARVLLLFVFVLSFQFIATVDSRPGLTDLIEDSELGCAGIVSDLLVYENRTEVLLKITDVFSGETMETEIIVTAPGGSEYKSKYQPRFSADEKVLVFVSEWDPDNRWRAIGYEVVDEKNGKFTVIEDVAKRYDGYTLILSDTGLVESEGDQIHVITGTMPDTTDIDEEKEIWLYFRNNGSQPDYTEFNITVEGILGAADGFKETFRTTIYGPPHAIIEHPITLRLGLSGLYEVNVNRDLVGNFEIYDEEYPEDHDVRIYTFSVGPTVAVNGEELLIYYELKNHEKFDVNTSIRITVVPPVHELLVNRTMKGKERYIKGKIVSLNASGIRGLTQHEYDADRVGEHNVTVMVGRKQVSMSKEVHTADYTPPPRQRPLIVYIGFFVLVTGVIVVLWYLQRKGLVIRFHFQIIDDED